MATSTTRTNKPLNPRGNDQSPLAFNRAKLYSGKALDFDGVNDNLSTDYAPSSNIQTTAYWVKLDNLSTPYALGGFVNGTTDMFGLYYWGNESNKNFGFNSWNADSYGIILPDFVDDWFHVVAEYNFSDFTQSKLFVNGQELSISQTRGTTLQRTTASRTFKIDSPSGSQKMNGKISGTKVFNTALTAAQVADLYNNPEKVVPTGVDNTALKLWLPMMEGAGTTAYDGSGNGNHGTISGATYVNGVGAPVAQSAVMDWNKGQNLYAYSEQFDESSYWSYTQIHAVDSTGNEAPDGSLTADKLIANTSTAFHHIGKGVTGITIGISYRLSVWAKAAGHDYILINTAGGSASGNAGPIVNLTNGSIAGSLNGEDYDATITDAGNGWYNIEYDFTSNGTTISIDYNQLPSASITAYAGDNTKGVYLWGVSLRPASSGSTYVRTGATAQSTPVLLPQGLTTGRDITGVNLFENVRKQGALNLDGNSWAEVHDNESLDFGTGSFTLEAWVRGKYVNQGSVFNVIISLGGNITSTNNAGLMVLNNVVPYFLYSNIASLGSSQTEGDWIHMVGTYDETNTTLYVNGVQVDQDPRTAVDMTNGFVKVIGRDGTDPNRYYNDQIAQPRIYNRALTAEEVQRSYDSGKNIYTNS